MRCVEIKHMHHCRVHPTHYYRRGGKCIECRAEWERRERAEREQNRLKRLERKARNTNIADSAQIGRDKRKETITKADRHRMTNMSKVSLVEKPGRWPTNKKQQNPGTQPALDLVRAPKEDQKQKNSKGQNQDPTLHKDKKNWMG